MHFSMPKYYEILTALTGAPIIASLPHFYLADKVYQTGVTGLNPVKEKHEIFSIFDPVSISCRLTYSHSPDAKFPNLCKLVQI